MRVAGSLPLCIFHMTEGRAAPKVEAVSAVQHVQPHVVDRHGHWLFLVRQVGSRYGASVHDVHGVLPNDLEPGPIYEDRGVLIDSDAEHAWVPCHSTQQAPDPATLGEVLVDHNISEEAQTRSKPIHQAAVSVGGAGTDRSEEHTSELQSRQYLVCRLLLEKKIRRRYPFLYSSILFARS